MRTTAKPAVQWWAMDRQRITADTVIGVDADALGGVAYVDFYVEGTTQRVTQTVYTDTDVNGNARVRLGYWITLSASAFLAKSASGTAQVYAMATANDATMQARVIGPLTVFPRQAAFDWDKTVTPSGGGDFTSLRAALDALAAAAPEAGRITLMETGTYDGGYPAAGAMAAYNGSKGYNRICAAAGVTATIVRGAAFDPRNTTTGTYNAAWDWWPGVNQLEFYGQNLVLDFTRFVNIRFTDNTKPLWFNGCTMTGSNGQRDTAYWNKQPYPGLAFCDINNVGVPVGLTDCTVRYVTPNVTSVLNAGNKYFNQFVGRQIFSRFVVGNYYYGVDSRYWSNPANAFSITYAGSGSTATVALNASSGLTAGSLVLAVNGAAVATIALGTQTYGSANFNVADVVNAVNGFGQGWSASLIDDSKAAVELNGFGATNAKGATVTAVCSHPIHAEWFHNFTFNSSVGMSSAIENSIFRNNIIRASYYATTWFNGGVMKDAIVKGNVYEGSAGDGSSLAGSHCYVANNVIGISWQIAWTYTYCDAYSRLEQNAIRWLAYANGPTSWTALPARINNIAFCPNGLPNGPNDSGNISLADWTAAFDACFTSLPQGDFRPTGALLNNLKPRIDPRDGRDNPRNTSDAIGSWASGYTAPVYPA